MAVYLSPVFGAGAQLFTNQGVVLAGGSVSTFVAGTTTPVATFADNSGATPNGVIIPLDSAGRLGSPTNVEMWIAAGTAIKLIVKDSTGVQIGLPWDNITGVNDPSGAGGGGGVTVWTPVPATPTFTSGTTFTVPGNLTSTFPVGTRVRSQVTAGTVYGTVSASAFGAVTTVTLVNDSTTLDSGLSAVATSANTVTGPNVGAAAVFYNASGVTNPAGSVGADLVAKAAVAATTTTNLNAVSKATLTAGGTTVYTLTPVPAIGSYVQGQTWLAQANVASTGSPTINISGQGAKNLKQINSAGSKIAATLVLNAIYELAYDGVDVVVMNPSAGAGVSLKRVTNFNAGGTWTKGADVAYVVAIGVGGGGAGGGTGFPFGGGGGGYFNVFVPAPGATETVTIGSGGVGALNLPGGGGAPTSFGAWGVATGGNGGNAAPGGAGGTGATGDLLIPGAQGNATLGGWSQFGASSQVAAAGAANTGNGGGPQAGTGFNGGSGRVIVYEYG